MPFTPRTTFPLSPSLPRSYYLGHHAAALREIKTLIRRINLVLEVRDYRIPLTSHNPMLDEALRNDGIKRKRIVVFTKRDVGNVVGKKLEVSTGTSSRRMAEKLKLTGRKVDGLVTDAVKVQALSEASLQYEVEGDAQGAEESTRDEIFFFHPTCPINPTHHQLWKDRFSPSALLRQIAKHISDTFSITGTRVLVTGIPNVGKSTLLNALRSAGKPSGQKIKVAKVAKVGGEAGVTRKMGTPVKILDGAEVDALAGLRGSKTRRFRSSSEILSEHETIDKKSVQDASNGPMYVVDSPGVFQPFVPDGESMLKLALCGCVKENLIPWEVLADYLIYRMNHVELNASEKNVAAEDFTSPKRASDLFKMGCRGYLSLIEVWARKRFGDEQWEKQLQGSSDYVEHESRPGLTNNTWHYLRWLALATGKLEKGGKPNYDATAAYFVQRWRLGECGRFILDEIDKETKKLKSSTGSPSVNDRTSLKDGTTRGAVSASQARKADLAQRRIKSRERARITSLTEGRVY